MARFTVHELTRSIHAPWLHLMLSTCVVLIHSVFTAWPEAWQFVHASLQDLNVSSSSLYKAEAPLYTTWQSPKPGEIKTFLCGSREAERLIY